MDDDEYHIDNLRDAIADYFANKPQEDTVPHKGLTRQALLELDALAATGRTVVETEPEIHSGGVGATTVAELTVAAVIVTRAEVTNAGLTPADLPHLRIID